MGTVRVAKIWRKMFDKDGTLPVSDTLSNVCLQDCALLYDYTKCLSESLRILSS